MSIEDARGLKCDQTVLDNNGNKAKVLRVTEQGFDYEYNQPLSFIPRWGMTITGGTCYWNGVELWSKI